jgi:hypothetical protein
MRGSTSYPECGERHIIPANIGLTPTHPRGRGNPDTGMGVSMEHASSRNSFNALFVLTFFASLAIVMIRFA